MLPLNIFEPRYQQLLRDVMAGSRQLVLASPTQSAAGALATVGCLAQVVQVQPQGEGRSHVLLRGEARVNLLDEQPELSGYRRFRAVPWPPAPPRVAPRALATLLVLVGKLACAAAGRDPPLVEVLRASSDPGTLVDYLAASLVRDVRCQQAVLAGKTLTGRIEAVTGHLASALLALVGEPLARSARD